MELRRSGVQLKKVDLGILIQATTQFTARTGIFENKQYGSDK